MAKNSFVAEVTFKFKVTPTSINFYLKRIFETQTFFQTGRFLVGTTHDNILKK